MSTTAKLIENYKSARSISALSCATLRLHVINNSAYYVKLRGRLGQRDIAKLLGATGAAVCHFENGRLKYLSDDLLVAMVEVYESLGAKHER